VKDQISFKEHTKKKPKEEVLLTRLTGGFHKKLGMCINLLDPQQHPQTIINVVNEMIDSSFVNVDEAIDIGTKGCV